MTLYFTDEQVKPFPNDRRKCAGCSRIATWIATPRGAEEKAPMCGWCVLYDSEWGYENRGDLEQSGRAAQELAAQFNKPVPQLDAVGRLPPLEAERYVQGICVTSRWFRDKMGLEVS